MGHWWRAHDEAIDDAKLLLLPSDRHRWGWFCLMCLASAYGGVLPPIDVVALKLRTSKQKANEMLAVLVGAVLLDEIEPGKFVPHNWAERQFKSDVTDPTAVTRMRNYRNRKRNGTVTVTATRDREQNTEKEKDAAAPPSSPEKELFDRGRQVLGDKAGGMVKNLLKAKSGDTALARAAIETASTKSNPREYVSGIIHKSEAAANYVDGRL